MNLKEIWQEANERTEREFVDWWVLIKSNQPKEDEICKWTYYERYNMYDTECGNGYCLTDGSLKENNHKYCTYCGLEIKLTK